MFSNLKILNYMNVYDYEALKDGLNLNENYVWINELEKHYLNNIIKTLNLKYVLDAGCGRGFKFDVLKKNNINFIGIDYSFYALKIAKIKHEKLVRGSILKLPFKDNFFDLVFSIQTISLMDSFENCYNAFREIVRVSKKYIIISEYKLGGIIKERYKPVIKENEIVLHRFSFKEDDYITWANQLNLKIIKIGTILNIKPKGIGKFHFLKSFYLNLDYLMFKLNYKSGKYLLGIFEKL